MKISSMMRSVILLVLGVTVQSTSATQADFEELYQNTTDAVIDVANELSRHLTPSALCAASKKCNPGSCISHGCGSDSFNIEYKCSNILNSSGLSGTCESSCRPESRLLSLSEAFIVTPPGTVQYGNKIMNNEREMILQDLQIRQHACAMKKLKNFLPDRFHKFGLKNWIYAASTAGVHSAFPGSARSREDGFEQCGFMPMQRPWYITAATGKKDVVFLFDTSLMESSKAGRKSLLDTLQTLDPRDYVSVISFSDKNAESLGADHMMVADENNIKQLIAAVKSLPISAGNPAVEEAFEKAFNLIEYSKETNMSTGCEKSSIIVLLLGKAPDCFSQCQQNCTCTEKIVNKINDLQKKHRDKFGTNVTVVAFTEGEDPHANRVARSLVCEEESKGIWQSISSTNPTLSSYGDITSMSLYSENLEPYASSVYLDANGLPELFTVATAVYEHDNRRLVGVVGADITVAQVEALVGKENAMTEIMKKSSQDRRCIKSSTLDAHDLCRIRSRSVSAPCADILPKTQNMCYKFKDLLFRRIEVPLTWEEAREVCQSFGDESDLANAEHQGVRSFLSGLVSYDGSWIGLKASQGNSLKWVNGEELTESVDEQVFAGNGNKRAKDMYDVLVEDVCVSMDRRGISQNGNLLPCLAQREAVCEIPAGSQAIKKYCSEIFDSDFHEPVNKNECGAVQACKKEEDMALENANPLCSDTTQKLTEKDRYCCGGKADESSVCPSAPLSKGAIAGISVFVVVLLTVVALFFIRRAIISNSNKIVQPPQGKIGQAPSDV